MDEKDRQEEHGILERTPTGPGLERPQGDFSITTAKKHESSEVRLGPIVKPVVAIILVTVVVQIAVYILYNYWVTREQNADRAVSPVANLPIENDNPELQVDEPAALSHFREQVSKEAEAYRWVDQQAGVAQIPVERAVEIIGSNGRLPQGEAWSLRPGEQMVGGVIMTPEQVQYANTPPSAAPAGEAPAPLRPAPGAAPQQQQAPQAAQPQRPPIPGPMTTNPRQQ